MVSKKIRVGLPLLQNEDVRVNTNVLRFLEREKFINNK